MIQTEYLLIKNAYKAPVRRVFDYLSVNELRNPNNKQFEMLSGICDHVIFFKANSIKEAESKMNHGDYLYRVSDNDKELVTICPPKKQKEA